MNIPHPSHYIQEEMDARGWTRDRLATAMMSKGDGEDWEIHRLAIDLYFEVGPTDPCLLIDEDSFARAFGVSEGLFLNLQAAWQRSLVNRTPLDAGKHGDEQPPSVAAVDPSDGARERRPMREKESGEGDRP
jgi:hypothetical protein